MSPTVSRLRCVLSQHDVCAGEEWQFWRGREVWKQGYAGRVEGEAEGGSYDMNISNLLLLDTTCKGRYLAQFQNYSPMCSQDSGTRSQPLTHGVPTYALLLLPPSMAPILKGVVSVCNMPLQKWKKGNGIRKTSTYKLSSTQFSLFLLSLAHYSQKVQSCLSF